MHWNRQRLQKEFDLQALSNLQAEEMLRRFQALTPVERNGSADRVGPSVVQVRSGISQTP